MDQFDAALCERFRALSEICERLHDLDENGVQSPTENPASGEGLRLSEIRTPLGEPMDQLDAEHLALNPIGWHMAYWLKIFYTGVYRGEDVMHMFLRIKYEISKIPDVEIANKLCDVWILQERLSRNEIPERYLCDVDRMLVDKSEKSRLDLVFFKTQKDTSLQARNRDREIEVCERIRDLYERLGNIAEERNLRKVLLRAR